MHRQEILNQLVASLVCCSSDFASLRQFLVHVIERARNLFGNVIDLEVFHHLAKLRQRAAITSRNRLTERDSFPDHLQVRAANATVLDVRLRFCTTLWAIHSIRNVTVMNLVPLLVAERVDRVLAGGANSRVKRADAAAD